MVNQEVSSFVENNGLAESHVTWTEIDGERRLTRVDAYGGLIGTLDLSGCTALQFLSCGGGGGEDDVMPVDISNNVVMANTIIIPGGGGQLTSLNVSGCAALKSLYCSDNQLQTLDISGCTALEYLDCSGNQLAFSSIILGGHIPSWLYCSS